MLTFKGWKCQITSSAVMQSAEPGRPWHALPVEQTRELIWGPLSNSISPSSKQFGEIDGFSESEAAWDRGIVNHGVGWYVGTDLY